MAESSDSMTVSSKSRMSEFFAVRDLMVLLLIILIDVVLAIASVVAIIPLSQLISQMIGLGSAGQESVQQPIIYFNREIGVATAMLIFFIANLLKGFSNLILQYQTLRVKYAVLKRIYSDLILRVFHAAWSDIEKVPGGVIVNVFTKEIHTLGDGLSFLVTRICLILQIVAYLAVPLCIDLWLTVSAVGFLVSAALPFFLASVYGKRLGAANLQSVNNLMEFISDFSGDLKAFYAHNKSGYISEKFSRLFDQHLAATLRVQVLEKGVGSFYRPIAVTGVFGLIGLSLAESDDLSGVAVLVWALISIVPLAGALIQNNISLGLLKPSFSQIFSLRDQLRVLQHAENNFTLSMREPVGISGKNVSLAFGTNRILDGVNFHFKPGLISAIVGPSGCGKSTLVDILLGLRKPDTGQLLVNNIPIGTRYPGTLRSAIGYVPQQPPRVAGSIAENIFFDCDFVDEALVKQLSEVADCGFIYDFTDGIYQQVGGTGVKLSGGQWQRIALLRALVSGPSILVLDEATSALDMQSEGRVLAGLKAHCHDMTVIFVSHRQAPVDLASDVLYL